MSKLLKTTVLALAASAAITGAAQSAQLLQAVSLSATPDVPNKLPVLEFKLKDGKYVLGKGAEQPFLKFRLKAKKMNDGRIVSYRVESQDSGKTFARDGAFYERKIDVSFKHRVRGEELNALVSAGRKICETRGDRDKVVDDYIKPGLRYKMVVEAVALARKGRDFEHRQARVPVQVICHPEPFKVQDADLSVKYHSNPNSCPVKVTLKAAFKANKPGTLKFNLYRGDGEFQNVTKAIGESGKVTFEKNYTINKSIDRKYLVASLPSGASSGWVPMKVNCSKKPASGGLQTAPKPHNN